MNAILITNGLLLLILMGFQQWYCARFSPGFFNPWEGLAGAFALVSLIIPTIAFFKSRLPARAKKTVIVSLLAFNPIVFSLISYNHQLLAPDWSWGQLAGPRIIMVHGPGQSDGIYGGLLSKIQNLGLIIYQTSTKAI